MNFTLYFTQFKRELWEHRVRFIYVPLLVTFLISIVLVFFCTNTFNAAMTLVSTISMPNVIGNGVKTQMQILNQDLPKILNAAVQGKFDIYAGATQLACIFNSTFLDTLLFILILFYAHNSLFDDRKSREILFWRSMPVSEMVNVMVKLFVIIFFFPFVVLLLNIAVTILSALLVSALLIYYGVSKYLIMTSLVGSHFLSVPFVNYIGCQLLIILALPVIGFMLMCSAYARKSPFLLSTLIPVMLIGLDKIFQIILGIKLYAIDVFSTYVDILINAKAMFFTGDIQWLHHSSINIMLIFAVGIAFIVSTIWLRNNRYEI